MGQRQTEETRWLQGWDVRPWCKPDSFEEYKGHVTAVWYGPEGREGNRATLVELSREAFIVTEYVHISEWYMDEPWDPDEHGDYFNLQVATFDPAVVRKLLFEHASNERTTAWRGVHSNRTRSPATRFRMPKDPKLLARWVAGIGVAYLGYYGGEGDTAETLP